METIFCPKCHKEVCQIRQGENGTEIVQDGKVLLSLGNVDFLANNSVILKCPDGHDVPVGHAKALKDGGMPEWAKELMAEASRKLAEAEQLKKELGSKFSSPVGVAGPPDPPADPVNFIATETPDPSNYIAGRYLSPRAATFTVSREEDAAGNFTAYVVSNRYGVPVYTEVEESHAERAIQWAVDNLPSDGGKVVLSEGTFQNVTLDLKGLTTNKPIVIEGRGLSTVVKAKANSVLFDCEMSSLQLFPVVVRNLKIEGTKTGETVFSLKNIMYFLAENLYIKDVYDFAVVENTVFDFWGRINIRNVTNEIFHFKGGGNDHYLHHVMYDSDASERPIGIHIKDSDALVADECDFIHCKKGLLIDPATGTESKWHKIGKVYFDTCDEQGVHISGDGTVWGVFFGDSWFATCGQAGPGRDGVVIDNANADSIFFENCHCHNHYGTGYYISAGNRVKIKGGCVSGVNTGNINANGIYINADVEVRGVYLGRAFGWTSNPLYHIFLDSGADAVIEENYLDDNVITSKVNLAGTYRIRRNVGYALNEYEYQLLMAGRTGAFITGYTGTSYSGMPTSFLYWKPANWRREQIISAVWVVNWNPQTASGGIRLQNVTDGVTVASSEPGAAGWRLDEIDITDTLKGYTADKTLEIQTKGDGSTAPQVAFAYIRLVVSGD